MKYELKEILNPKSIAIVGASNNPEKWSYEIMQNVVQAGFEGEVYPINPKDNEIQGYKAYKSILDVEGDIDMISVCVAAKFTPEIIRQAVQKGVKLATIFSSGYREAGREDLEEEILDIIKDTDLRVLGPNIQGIINTSGKLSNIFNMTFPREGNVGVVTQSGSVSAYITEKMDKEKVGISSLINLGNQIDLSEHDFINYYAEDENTDVIALYVEGPKDKRLFSETIRKAAPRKPIVVMKPGSTEGGAKAAASHTGSIAGNDKIFSYACKQFGIIRCENMTEYSDTILGLATTRKPQGNRVIIFSTSGGMGSVATDELIKNGMELAELPNEVIEELKQETGAHHGIGGLMDLADNIDNYRKIIEILDTKYEEHFDTYFFMIADGLPGIEEIIDQVASKTDKTVIVSYMSDSQYKEDAVEYLRDRKIPVYECPDRAAVVLRNLHWYNLKSKELKKAAMLRYSH